MRLEGYAAQNWRLAFDYNKKQNEFELVVDGMPYFFLPYHVDSLPTGPRNIIGDSTIYLNDLKIHKGFMLFNEETFDELLKAKDFTYPVTAFKLNWFKSTHLVVLN